MDLAMHGYAKFDGIAPPGAKVDVVDDDDAGRIIARCVADDDGLWEVESVALAIGCHSVRGVAVNANGVHCESSAINVTVEAEHSPVEITRDDEPAHSAADEAERHYAAIVRARAAGYCIDSELGSSVLSAAGRSMNDFCQDVVSLETAIARERDARDRAEALFGDYRD